MARNYKKGIEVLKIYIVDRACVQEEALNRRRRRRRQRGNFARASRFYAHFFANTTQPRSKTA